MEDPVTAAHGHARQAIRYAGVTAALAMAKLGTTHAEEACEQAAKAWLSARHAQADARKCEYASQNSTTESAEFWLRQASHDESVAYHCSQVAATL